MDQITVLVGKNGVGKSNILEAIVLLSYCRSYREDRKINLINFNSEFARISGDDLELFLSKEPQFYMKARQKSVFKKLTEFVGLLQAVVFSPETLSIITGSPKERRRFLDIMISQTDKEYLRSLVDYDKARKQRNSLLRAIKEHRGGKEELDWWDGELSRIGGDIIKKREQALKLLNAVLPDTYRKIAGNSDFDLNLSYLKSSNDLALDLAKFRNRDILEERTNLGPHKDDLVFHLNDRNMQNFASRGEIKSAILSLKIGELHFLKERQKAENGQPILLLDDIFSEFDSVRRKHLSNLIMNYQTLITTTEKEHLSKELLKKAKIVEL